MTTTEMYWDVAKFVVPFVLALVGWAWRVESRLAAHDMMMSRLTQATERLEKTLDSLEHSKEITAERMATIAAKLDILLLQRQDARLFANQIPLEAKRT